MADVTPFFSVVIPVYNRGKLLGTALRSVLAQTCQDFEIIVVDDGSKDDPKRVVDDIGDPRIRFFRQPNRGGGAARNNGIDQARGKFVALLDSDDEFLPQHLARMKALLEGTTNTVGYARILVARGRGTTFQKPARAVEPGEDMATYLLCDRGFVPTSTSVVPIDIARKVRYPERLRLAEDTDFAIRLALAGCRFVMVKEPGGVWKDIYDPNRSSAGRESEQLGVWLETMRLKIPTLAYHGCRGWAFAKGVASESRAKALGLYLNAVVRGCYNPLLAVIVFLQVFLPDRVYRRIADTAILWLKAGFRPGGGVPAFRL